MSELRDVLKTLKALEKIVIEKEAPNGRAEAYKLGYTCALDFAMSIIKDKIIEAEEKENA